MRANRRRDRERRVASGRPVDHSTATDRVINSRADQRPNSGADYETAERSALKEGMEAYATATA